MGEKVTNLAMIAALVVVAASARAQPSEPNRIQPLFEKARELESRGSYFEAVPLVEELLWTAEKNFGPDHSATVSSLIWLGRLYQKAGAYDLSEPLLERALTTLERTGAERPDTAAALNDLASLYYSKGQYARAETLYKRALAIDVKSVGREHRSTATTLGNLGLVYLAQSQFETARQVLTEALEIRTRVLPPEHPSIALSLNSLGELNRTVAQYSAAESSYTRALSIAEKALGPEHPNTATILNNLALVHLATGDYVRAEPLLKQALTIREKVLGPMHPDTRQSLTNLGSFYHDTGAYKQAEVLFTRALAIAEKALGPEHPATASSLTHLAALHRVNKAHDKAAPLFQRALAIREKVLGPEHPDTAGSQKSLAALYHVTGTSYVEAEKLYKRALTIEERVLGREHPSTAATRANLAALLHDTGHYAEAESQYKQALAIDEKVLGERHPNTASLLKSVALLSWALGRWSESYEKMERSLSIEDWNARSVSVLGDESRKSAYAETLRNSGELAIGLSLALRGKVPASETLALKIVLQRKGRVQDTMADTFARARASLSPSDQELLEQWRRVNGLLAALTFRDSGAVPAILYRKLIEGFDTKARDLEARLSQHSAEFRTEIAPVTVDHVQRMLPPSTALVEWFRYRPFNPRAVAMGNDARWNAPQYVAFVLKGEGAPAVVEVGEAAPIERTLLDFLAALHDPGNTQVDRLARELDEKLMEPLRGHLGEVDRILLSPDGLLNLVPFGVLRDERGRYLVQQKELTYLTSGRDLLRLASRSPTPGPPLVLAAPDYDRHDATANASRQQRPSDRGGAMRFGPLPGTAAEAHALKTVLHLQDQQVLTGTRATESALKHAKGPRILHLATHGFFLSDQARDITPAGPFAQGPDTLATAKRENPLLRSGLALAGANQPRLGDDGILTALEVSGLDLSGTELAVLSACETGKGEVTNGEGVYGLRRALVLAGVRTQVVSLWKVDDAATRELMVDYYTRLSAGAGRSQAMRAAQLAMLANPRRAHPFYWAAFVVIGEGKPLTH